MDINRIRTSLWIQRKTQRLLRKLAGTTEETIGEVVERLVESEADRRGVRLTEPDRGQRRRRRLSTMSVSGV